MDQNLESFAKKISKTRTHAPNMGDYIQGVSYERVIGDFESNRPVTVVTLSKDEIASPELEKCIDLGLFDKDIKAGRKVVIKCSDKDLAFNQEEAMRLIKNHEALSKNGGEMVFEETISKSSSFFNDSFDLQQNDVLVSFPEMMKVNAKLTRLADMVKQISKRNHLSPYEKYLLCHKVVSEMQYYFEADDPLKKHLRYFSSQSYIETVTKNAGCCVGKAEYLRALLSMVGIKACTIGIDADREEATYFASRGFPEEAQESMKVVKNKEHSDFATNHRVTLISLDDSKYGMHGIFVGDASSKGAPDTIPVGVNLDKLFNYGGLYDDGERICDFLDDLPSAKKQKKDYSNYKQELASVINVLGRSATFNQYRHQKVLEAFSRLEQARIAKAPFFLPLGPHYKIDEIYKNMYPAAFGRIIKGEISKITNEDLEFLGENPKEFWTGVTMILPSAFRGCTNLVTITIPYGVTMIGFGAFSGCTNLKSVTLSNSIKIIRSDTFKDCTSLENITISDEVISIECDAFLGCTSLEKIRLEYAKGKFVDVKYEELYAMAGVDVDDGLNKAAIAKVKAIVSQRVARGELKEVEVSQKKKAGFSILEAVVAAARTRKLNNQKIAEMGDMKKAISSKERVKC